MNEELVGEGDVVVKKTGEHVARASYRVTVMDPRPGRLGEVFADIALQEHTARRLLRDGAVLTLRMDDGRSFDFLVSRVSGDGFVEVTSTGGLASRGEA